MSLQRTDRCCKTLEKANFAMLQHELEYQSKSVRGFCGVCHFTEQHEDHKGTKSTQLMCVSCRVWVCNSSPCLMAHLKFGRGNAVRQSEPARSSTIRGDALAGRIALESPMLIVRASLSVRRWHGPVIRTACCGLRA